MSKWVCMECGYANCEHRDAARRRRELERALLEVGWHGLTLDEQLELTEQEVPV
jgi:hypothetical protein